MNNRIIKAILPEAVEETGDFQAGVIWGYHSCGNDLAAGIPTTDEARDQTIEHFKTVYAGEYPPDTYAGWLAGYNVRRDNERANNGGPKNVGRGTTAGLPDQGKMPTAPRPRC